MNHCGECGVCCTWLTIDDPVLPKPAGVRCFNLAAGGGCAIYEGRPRACVEFKCVWLHAVEDGKGPPAEMRPDRAGVMLDAVGPRTLIARCAPGRPEAWKAAGVRAYLERAVRAGAAVIISVEAGSRRKLVMTAEPKTGVIRVRSERFTAPDAAGVQRQEGKT